MRFQKVMAVTAATILGLSLAACGDDDDERGRRHQ